MTYHKTRRPIPQAMLTDELITKIAERVAMTDGGCLIWMGSRGDRSTIRLRSYPYIHVAYDGGRPAFLVTRLILTWVTGEDPGPLDVDHLETCPKMCVHPDHLTAMTHGDNIRKWAATITHCPHGHEYTVENTYVAKGPNGGTARLCRTCNRERKRTAEVTPIKGAGAAVTSPGTTGPQPRQVAS